MASLNQCNIIGNLGKDPEVRPLQSGKKVASFSIACSETWKDKTTGEKKERTEWIPCTCFDPLAGVIERYVKKGSKVFVSGQFQTRSWDDPSGQKRYKSEIMVKDLVMLDSKREGQGGGYAAGASAAQNAGSGAGDDGFGGGDYAGDDGSDLPF